MSSDSSSDRSDAVLKTPEKPVKKKSETGWILRTVILTFLISSCLSFISEGLSENFRYCRRFGNYGGFEKF